MHHVALDGSWPDDGHFDNQVVEGSGTQPGQHAHLGSALDLKHANRIGPADHIVNVLILCGDGCQTPLLTGVLVDQIKGSVNGAQHPQRQTVHLENPQFIQVVFIPFDDGASGHRRVFDGA